MEPLSAAVHSSAALQALLQEAAALHACGRCCLRLAGIRSAAAYSDSKLPTSAADVLVALRLAGQADEAADADADGGPSKRRRVEAGADQQPDAAAACEGAADGSAAVDGELPPQQQQACAPAVCPLCLGLLQLPELARGGGISDTAPSCPLQLATTASALNDPARYSSLNWGSSAAAAADGSADSPVAPAAAAAEGEADGGAPPGGSAIAVQRQVAAVPSLAAAAGGIAGEFELDSFSLEVSLPASLAVRQQALAWRLRQRGTPEGEAAAAQLRKAVDAKEAVRLCFAPALEAALGKPHDGQSDMRIALSISHPAAAAECGWLAPAGGGGRRERRGGWGRHGKQQRQQGRGQAGQQQQPGEAELPALTDAVVQRLAAMPQADFAAGCPAAAAQLAPPAAPATVQLQARRLPLHIGGRYLKLRRGIPQSPWFIDGARKGEGSVQEAIEQGVLPSLQADSYTLVSAGREDIDVRMLGEGRPFILEVHNARRRVPPAEQLQQLEARVAAASHGGVAVRGLFAASPSQLALLKQGEQEKQKSYVAVCWLPRPLSDADVALLAGTRELEVQQDTPVRVLHRRANLCRPKVIHELRAEALPGQPPGYFALHLRTQAGTYIKEFVHGDLGRTRPSLGDLLGCQAEIVSLDVTQIHMAFGAEPANGAA